MKTNKLFRGMEAFGAMSFRQSIVAFTALILTLFQSNIFGQSNQLETLKGMQQTVASYDADVREAVLTASQCPVVLVNIQNVHNQAKNSFQNVIKDFSQKKQGWFYELTRYPDLLHTLATAPSGKSRDEIESLLPNKDENLATAAWKLYSHHEDDLDKVDQLYQQAEDSFKKTIQPLDPTAQSAFTTLAKYPDVMLFLNDNLDITQQLGKKYISDQNGLKNELAATHDSLVVQNQAQLAAYKRELDKNPQAKQELNQAAKDFARSNGYILPNGQIAYGSGYGYGYANPYSYWFGYPYWYGSALWYPGAYWGSFGMTYGFGGWGYGLFPAYGFSNWFFNGGYYMNYPNLYRHYGNYYRNVVAGRPNYYRGNTFGGTMNNHFTASRGSSFNGGSRPSYGGNYGGGFRSGGFSGGGRSFGGGGGRHR